jgi:hypothetical protein
VNQSDLFPTDSDNEGPIAGPLKRYQNVLETQIRYCQPDGTVMVNLLPDKDVKLSRFVCTHAPRWVLTGVLVYVTMLVSAFGMILLHGIGTELHLPKAVLALFTNALAILSLIWGPLLPAFYFGHLTIDSYLGWGKQGSAALRGPTHIAISPVSLKLIWKGRLMVCTGGMFGWDEITRVFLEFPDEGTNSSAPSVWITAIDGGNEHTIPIRLDGFQTRDDLALFLEGIDSHVSDASKTDLFREHITDKKKRELLIEEVRANSVDGLLAEHQEAPALLARLEDASVSGLLITKSQQATLSSENLVLTPKEPVEIESVKNRYADQDHKSSV